MHTERLHPLVPSFRRNRVVLQIVVWSVVFIVFAVATFTSLYLRKQAVAHTEVTTKNLAQSIMQTMDGMIATLDVTLQVTADELNRQLLVGSIQKPEADRFMLRQQQRLPHLAYLRAADEHGNSIYGQGVLSPPTNIADRAYFVRLKASTQQAAVLEHQLVLGRITGKYVWVFARRLNKADGSFGGVVYSSLSSELITRMFAQMALDQHGSIALRESDTSLVARYTADQQQPIPLGDKRMSDAFKHSLQKHPAGGVYVSGDTSVDGISRTHAYLRSQPYGFLVNVGAGGQTSLKDWRIQTWVILGLATSFGVALLGFAFLLCRSWRHQEFALTQMAADAQTLRESEERFHSLFHSMSEGVALHQMVFDPQGQAVDYGYLDANPAFEVHTGLRVEHVKHRLASQVFEMTPPPFLDIYAQVVQSGHGTTFEEYFAPMRKRFLIHVMSPAKHQFATIFEDITERYDMVRRLRESEALYELVTENISDVIWMVDITSQKILYISPSIFSLLGITVEEITSRPIEASLPLESIEPLRHKVQQKMADLREGNTTKMVDVVDIDLRHKNGAIVHTELVLTYLLNEETGQLATIFGVTRDVSERRQHEAAQALAKKQLEDRLTEISALQGRLQEQATRDPLTGLHNRRFMDETLPRELARAKREGKPLVMIMLDIDHFKRVNDTYGHAAGDEVLKVLAQMLRTEARESDVICRYGGEEFLVALPGMTVAQAHDRVEQWRAAMAQTRVPYGEFYITVTLSAGVAGFPDHGSDVDTLLARADQALYGSKQNGRNCVTVWGQERLADRVSAVFQPMA